MALTAIIPHPFELDNNDTDWCHLEFRRILEGYGDPNRPLNLGRASREHSLYGPTTTRICWICPPSHRFMIKPQALLMPEVSSESGEEADTSIASIEAQDGDISIDSMGGEVVSQGRDVYLRRDRQEIDLLLTKVVHTAGSSKQVSLLVVELKRDDEVYEAACDQILQYLRRVQCRLNATDYGLTLCGLLILGAESIRFESVRGDDFSYQCLDGKDVQGDFIRVGTDSVEVNTWLVEHSRLWDERIL